MYTRKRTNCRKLVAIKRDELRLIPHVALDKIKLVNNNTFVAAVRINDYSRVTQLRDINSSTFGLYRSTKVTLTRERAIELSC